MWWPADCGHTGQVFKLTDKTHAALQSWTWMTFPHGGIIRSLTPLVIMTQGVQVAYSAILYLQVLRVNPWTMRGDKFDNSFRWRSTRDCMLNQRIYICLMFKCFEPHGKIKSCAIVLFNLDWWCQCLSIIKLLNLYEGTITVQPGGIRSIRARHCFSHTAWPELEEMCFTECRDQCAIESQEVRLPITHSLTHRHVQSSWQHCSVNYSQ